MDMDAVAEKMENKKADKLFNVRPIFFVAIFLCLGVAFSYFCIMENLSPLWSLLLLPIAAFSLFLCENKEKRNKAVLLWSVLLLFFVSGTFFFSVKVDKFQALPAYNKDGVVTGTVIEIANYGEYARLELRDITIDGNTVKGQLNAYLPSTFYQNVQISDEVILRGYISTDTSLTGDFGFRAQDIRLQRAYTLSSMEACDVAKKSSNVFLAVRARMQTVMYAGMNEGSAAVTMAMLTGNSAGIESGLLQNIRAGGIAHVFAVSGLHIGSLYAFCLLIIQKTSARKLPKAARFLLTATVLFFYVGVCGFTASSVRAMIMCLTAYAMKLLEVKEDFLQSLGLSAIVLLILTPTALFEAGFQLSFAACLGLALFTKPFQRALLGVEKYFKKERDEDMPIGIFFRVWRKGSKIVSVSLAAQIATAPILLYWFGFVSGWTLLLNVLFVPIISGVFALLLLLVFLACVLPATFSTVLLYLPSTLWQALLLVFEIFDFSSFAWTRELPLGSVLCYYGGGLFATDIWNISKRLKWTLILLCFFGFGVTMFALNA